MTQSRAPKTEWKRDWVLTHSAFRRLLDFLDEGAASDGRRYLDIRQRLVRYFDRKNCSVPDELADETLNRVARRLEEEGSIVSDAPAHYCYIVARYVFLEYLRRPGDEELDSLEGVRAAKSPTAVPELTEDHLEKERRAECLGRCLQALSPEHRELITTYYTGEQRLKIETRRALASTLAITVNALSIRACRIREKLEACVTKCLGAP